MTFLAVPRLSRALHLVPQGAHAVVELDGSFMDHAAYESLQDWQNAHTAHGGTVELVGRRSGVRIGEPTGPAGLQAGTEVAADESADCRCHPWTPWRNHQCEIPEAAPPRDGQPGEARATGTEATDGSTAPSGAETPDGTTGTGTGRLDTVGGPGGSCTSGSADSLDQPGNPRDGKANAGEVAGEGTAAGDSAATRTGTRPGPDVGRPSARQLARGISAFQRNTAPLVRSELARLAREGQQPSQLFLTCADSRLVTSMITSSGPGDLFVVRNMGNLVPLPGRESGDDSVAAAIEYAVDVLQVRSITVCGHSGCGAMQALLTSEPGASQTPFSRWLRHGRPSLERMSDESRPGAALAGRAPADAVEQLCLTNVVQQLEHLRAHESVARALGAGALELHGMYFHVGEAQAYLLAEGREDEVFDHVGVADLSA